MKSYSCLVLTVAALCFIRANAQVSLPSPTAGSVVVETGPHHRVWQTVTIAATGQTNVSSFTEVATGLNVWNPVTGKYEPSKEQFQIVGNGSAIATNGQHQVILAADINSGGSVDLLMPDGQRLLSNPMGLSFFDTSSGKNVLIGEVTNCIGQLVSSNVVLYANAFDALKAAIRYTYTKEGFEQDVILFENPGSPADYGLNPSSTVLEMYSEFFSPSAPQKQLSNIPDDSLVDETLDFGQMQIGRGQAYFLNETLKATDVAKSWTRIADRTFLVESVPYLRIKSMLDKMALTKAQASNRPNRDRKSLVAGLRPREKEMKVASIRPAKAKPGSGLVIDYVTKNSNLTNFLWQGDTTYYISGNVGLYGTNTTWEAGSILKYASNVAVTVNTPVTWLATAYRPIVMTAKDDNSLGDAISGSTGSPSGPNYANPALQINNGNTQLHDLRVAYAQAGIFFSDTSAGNGNALTHAQFVHCNQALKVNGYGAAFQNFAARNLLINDCSTAFYGYSFAGDIEHLTLNQCDLLANDYNGQNYGTTSSLSLTNSILAGVTNLYGARVSTISGDHNGFYNCPTFGYGTVSASSNPFQTVGAGGGYLVSGGNFRNAGTTAINSSLAADLKKKTTYPPMLASSPVSTPTTWSPQAQRDTDAPDIGYHYDPLDCLINNVSLTSFLTLTNGVAVGVYGTYGINLTSASASLVSEGAPSNLNRFTRYQTVQEQPVTLGGSPTALLFTSATDIGSPTVVFRFTDIPALAYGSADGPRSFISNLPAKFPRAVNATLQDCQLRGSTLGLANSTASYPITLAATNNFVERGNFFIRRGASTTVTAYFRNNLFWQTGFDLWYNYYPGGSNPTWDIRDNVFDNDGTVTEGGTNYTSYILSSYNGYVNTSVLAGSGGNDQSVSNFTYSAGPCGPWYQSSTNMIDKGSRASDLAGLYHYTTQVNQAKETNSVVDIGFHYIALDANGNAIDIDGDGLPDYLEDRNGNGTTESGETDWQNPYGATDLGLKVWITEPKSNSNFP